MLNRALRLLADMSPNMTRPVGANRPNVWRTTCPPTTIEGVSTPIWVRVPTEYLTLSDPRRTTRCAQRVRK
jgi:hypothetical protein